MASGSMCGKAATAAVTLLQHRQYDPEGSPRGLWVCRRVAGVSGGLEATDARQNLGTVAVMDDSPNDHTRLLRMTLALTEEALLVRWELTSDLVVGLEQARDLIQAELAELGGGGDAPLPQF